MIKVDVVRDNEGICEVKMYGHSGYEDSGRDIVCAAASTLMINSINLLEEFGCSFDKVVDENAPLMQIIIKSHDNASDKILKTLVKDLNDVSEGYKKFIKIIENRR